MSSLTLSNISKRYPVRRDLLGRVVDEFSAVDGVSLTVPHGKTLGLVGESGCGKTTLGRIAVRLLQPTTGEVRLDGRDFARFTRQERKQVRPKIQMVFQDTQTSLDPRMTVEAIVAEPLRANRIVERSSLNERVTILLERCGLDIDHLQRYPHELSGGQRQRVVIARALATEPDVIVLDEPTSALDVSVQAQVLNLLKDVQDELGLTYVFISHDLGVVRFMSDDVAVMYLGRIVEKGPAEEVFTSPLHPYTKLLLRSVPRPDPSARAELSTSRPGEVAAGTALPAGCGFAPRCPHARPACGEQPELRQIGGHDAACWAAESWHPNGVEVG
ncbi:oligopeptide transport system ATP-binding protein [Micromonospora rhizosphaerae]|uniref:Oligopeptide transport system ATP-binding protein n=1 Tax=Micromonospora rhizosphaerae TaxID=568872 RepID=A0A1C6T3R8_9ACTN|nr:ABC transporter ATP-binding protein [Micromonospora rhizosphaerae]SCL36424.1 oligopeptide transport system ATP-binding protein [Micromonospora rhizosphaerae]